jgi:alpha/beta superfamily hydrolase
VEKVRELAASTSNAELVLIPEADHFFLGKLDQVRSAISEWLATQFLSGSQTMRKEVSSAG